MQIAEQENADMLIGQLAVLLHDVDDVKLSPETHEAKKNAVGFMKNNGVDEKVIASVCKIIDEVSFAGTDSVVSSTLEGKCVQDADRLDAIGAIGIARTFAYGGSKGRRIHDPDIKPMLYLLSILTIYTFSSISSSIFTNPYLSYKGRPISVASNEICNTPCSFASLTSKSNV